MYVYGIRCAPCDLASIDSEARADYYIDYGLLIFPQYTTTSCVTSNTSTLARLFWDRAAKLIERPQAVYSVTREHPWITDEEEAVVTSLRELYPNAATDWYYVPRLATQESGPFSADD